MTPEIVVRASNFSMERHAGQTRKYTGEPYWNHTAAVAATVEEWGGTPEMIAAAYLHDTIEDTGTTYFDLERLFGARVAGLVQELTDEFTPERYPDMNRAERKDAEARRLATVSLEAQVIKLADMQDNTKDIAERAPAGFAKKYLAEKAFVHTLIGNALAQWRAR